MIPMNPSGGSPSTYETYESLPRQCTSVVTGANSGIGFATLRLLALRCVYVSTKSWFT